MYQILNVVLLQNLVVANKIGDKAFMQQQINCILGPDSACDDIGLKAKRIGPLVLSNHCPRPMCDECTKKAVRMVVVTMYFPLLYFPAGCG